MILHYPNCTLSYPLPQSYPKAETLQVTDLKSPRSIIHPWSIIIPAIYSSKVGIGFQFSKLLEDRSLKSGKRDAGMTSLPSVVSVLLQSSASCQQPCWGCTWPHCQSSMKVLKSISPKSELWGTHSAPSSTWTLSHGLQLCLCLSSQFLIHWMTIHPSNPHLFCLEISHIMWDCTKGLTEV